MYVSLSRFEFLSLRKSMGVLRLIVRLPLLLLHSVLGTPATVLTFYPPFKAWRVGGEPLQNIMLHWWARTVCRIFGVRVVAHGSFRPGAQLVVANHVSWLDPQVLHSLSPMGFVAKSEIARWPIFGFVAKVGGTVFHRRGSHDSASGVASAMAERLAAGGKVAIFPEGGILPGDGVKRFHARLFAAAVDVGIAVQPVAIRYLKNGEHFHEITFLPGESFVANVLRLLAQAPVIVEAFILEPIGAEGIARRELAMRAEIAVRAAFDSPPGGGRA